MENKELKDILWKLIGVSKEICEEYFQSKYQNMKTIRPSKPEKHLPFSKKLDHTIIKHINETTKKLDLDILFLASFHDMSNQFTNYLYSKHIDPKTIVENYKKLTKIPMISQM